jgi:hypothetical protein
MKFVLTIEIDVDLGDESQLTVEGILHELPARAASEGLFTGYTYATVNEWDYALVSVPDDRTLPLKVAKAWK